MLKFALKKQSAQSNLFSCKKVCEESTLNMDETVNISKFPLLYATPERTKETVVKRGITEFERVKSLVEIQHANDNEVSFTSIKPIDYESDATFINEKVENTVPLAYINQFSNSPLSSTAINDSCYSFSEEEQFTSGESTEQFHSVNGSFFDIETKDLFYVCCQSFEATNTSQLSLNYSDVVKLIYRKNDNLLVESIKTGKRGLVPQMIISDLTKPWVNSNSLNV
jgi:hypothetical protein